MDTGIYVRVSTEEQVQEGYSIRAQQQKLKDFAGIKDWPIYNIYADEGISGKNLTERPAITRLIEDVKVGHIKNVLVFKIDRLTRSTADLIYLVDLFNQYDCAFNSLMESIDTQTASGRMFLKIIGIFAEFERENIIERIKLGLERKVKEGYTVANRCISYGYYKDVGQKVQAIYEPEAEIVREIFGMYVKQGMSLIGIAKVLNLRGIPTKGGSVWDHHKVKCVLKNCNYIGQVRHYIDSPNKAFVGEGMHEAILPAELFEEAQALLVKNARISPTKKPKVQSYFSGILVCGLCGEKFDNHQVGHSNNYNCRNRKLKICSASGVSHKKVETAFLDYIERIDPFSVADEVKMQEQKQEQQRNLRLIQEYQEKLKQQEQREKEILQLYVRNEIEFESYRDMKAQIRSDRDIIQAEIERRNVPEENEPTIRREDIITSLKENWNTLTDSERRQFLVRFIKRIEIVNEIPEGQRFGIVKILAVEFQGN